MPREVFGQAFRFLPQAELLTFEEIARLARAGRGPRRAQDPPHRRRAAAAPGPARSSWRMLAGIDGLEDLTLTTNGSLLAEQGAGARRGRPAAHHREPRLARRRGLRAAQRRALPGGAAWSPASTPPSRRPGAHQGQHGRAAWRQRGRASCRWPASPASAATSCASSSTWTSATPTAGSSSEVVPAAEIVARIDRRAAPGAPAAPVPGRGRDALALPRRRRRGRRHRLGHAALLRRLHARPADRRGAALHVPLRRPRHGPAGAAAEGRRRCRHPCAAGAHLGRTHRPLLRAALVATADLPKVEMSRIGG